MSAIVLKPAVGGEALTITRDVVVGRNEACDVVLKSSGVSGKHARLCVKEGRLSLEDLGSTNGTFVNGARVPKQTETPLANGDRVKFDDIEFEVVLPPSGDRTQIRAVPQPAQDKTVLAPPPKAPDAPVAVAAPKAAGGRAAAAEIAARPPAAGEAPPAPRPSASAEAPPAPRPSAPADAPRVQAAKRAPGAWADPSNQPKGKTMFMSKEALQDIFQAPVVPNTSLTEPHLQVLSGQSKGKSLPLRGSGPTVVWKVGSEAGEDGVKLDDQGVSAFHAIIERKDNRWKVADQMSANGTFVNGEQVTVRYLSTDDKVRFGPVDCVFRVPKVAEGRSKALRLSFWPIALISFAVTVALLWVFLR